MRETRVGRVVFGIPAPLTGGLSRWNILADAELSKTLPKVFAPPPEIVAGFMAAADIYDFGKLAPGNAILGPAVIHTPITTIVLQDKQRGTMDGFRNVVIEFDA